MGETKVATSMRRKMHKIIYQKVKNIRFSFLNNLIVTIEYGGFKF